MLRTQIKIFLTIFLPLFFVVSAIFFFSYRQEVENSLDILESEDVHQVHIQNQMISQELQRVTSDLKFLVDLYRSYSSEEGDNLEVLTSELLSFALHRGTYDQLRFIDISGMERIRINYNLGDPATVQKSSLQDKGSRYYFNEAIKLKRNEIFLSPFDLNIEQGKIERPFKSMLRIATPVFDREGEKRGIFILNYLPQSLLTPVSGQYLGETRLMLINSEGYWLHGADEGRNWGFMFPDGKEWTIGQFYPDVWHKIASVNQGRYFQKKGSFVWDTIIPSKIIQTRSHGSEHVKLPAKNPRFWKIVIFRSQESIDTALNPIRKKFLGFYLALTIALFLGTIVIGGWRANQRETARNKGLLQEAHNFTNLLLKSALSSRSLEQEMEHALKQVLSISWLSVMAKGAIFLMDEETNELVLVAQKDLSKPLLTKCARLKMGQCLCGRAAESKAIVFANCLDHRHEITFDGIQEHGHICVPIVEDEKVLGVLNLYVEHGHTYNPLYDEVLITIAHVLAGIIDRKRADERLVEAHNELKKNHDTLVFERSIVEETLLRIRSTEEFDSKGIRYLMAPVEDTAGDILLSARRPNGVHHVLLGDFTGHGLPSALGGPAVAEIFYAMTRKDFPGIDILSEINNKLCEKLPTHLYLAACFIEFDPAANRMSLWNAGLQDPVLFRNNALRTSYPSTLPPLGITTALPIVEKMTTVEYEPGDRLFAYSDGVIEAVDDSGELFGRKRFEVLLARILKEGLPLETVMSELADYQTRNQQTDDITIVEIPS